MGRAAALLEYGDATAAMAALDRVYSAAAAAYQPYWVTRAAVLRRCGQPVAARAALERALDLTRDGGVREHLARQLTK